MRIAVKTVAGEIISGALDVERSDTIGDVKQRLLHQEGFPPEQQRLVCGGVRLEDGRTLSDYRIETDATLHLMMQVRGGEGCLATTVTCLCYALDPSYW